jgi:Zn-dependent protease with chaperone function
MEKFIWMLLLLTVTGCATQRSKLVWRVKDMVLEQSSVVHLQDAKEQIVLTVPTRTIQEIMLAHIRISRTANVQSEIYIAAGDDPNAFAGPDINGRQIIGISLGMVKLIGEDRNEYAALIGHEAAHLARGHGDSSRLRTNTLDLIGTVVGAGLGMAGVPAGGLVSGLGVDVIDSAYNRDQEREADAAGIEYMIANQYDPNAAIRLHEKMLKRGSGLRLPFLSSHPSGDERIENLKALIEARIDDKKSTSSSQVASDPVAKEQ